LSFLIQKLIELRSGSFSDGPTIFKVSSLLYSKIVCSS
jgi:hypothetical protein